MELYAKGVGQGNLFGFIEAEDLVFGEKSAVLIDPSEEGLRQEFENTKRIYIPLHSVLRIEEIDVKKAQPRAKLLPMPSADGSKKGAEDKVTPFYLPPDPFK